MTSLHPKKTAPKKKKNILVNENNNENVNSDEKKNSNFGIDNIQNNNQWLRMIPQYTILQKCSNNGMFLFIYLYL